MFCSVAVNSFKYYQLVHTEPALLSQWTFRVKTVWANNFHFQLMFSFCLVLYIFATIFFQIETACILMLYVKARSVLLYKRTMYDTLCTLFYNNQKLCNVILQNQHCNITCFETGQPKLKQCNFPVIVINCT